MRLFCRHQLLGLIIVLDGARVKMQSSSLSFSFQGAKKLCPQCNMITSPSDLRKIYLWLYSSALRSCECCRACSAIKDQILMQNVIHGCRDGCSLVRRSMTALWRKTKIKFIQLHCTKKIDLPFYSTGLNDQSCEWHWCWRWRRYDTDFRAFIAWCILCCSMYWHKKES